MWDNKSVITALHFHYLYRNYRHTRMDKALDPPYMFPKKRTDPGSQDTAADLVILIKDHKCWLQWCYYYSTHSSIKNTGSHLFPWLQRDLFINPSYENLHMKSCKVRKTHLYLLMLRSVWKFTHKKTNLVWSGSNHIICKQLLLHFNTRIMRSSLNRLWCHVNAIKEILNGKKINQDSIPTQIHFKPNNTSHSMNQKYSLFCLLLLLAV